MKNKLNILWSIGVVVVYPIVASIALLVAILIAKESNTFMAEALSGFLILASIFLIPPIVSGLMAHQKPGLHAFLGSTLSYALVYLVLVPSLKHYVSVNDIDTNLDFSQKTLTLSRAGAFTLLSLFSGLVGYLSAKIRDRFSR